MDLDYTSGPTEASTKENGLTIQYMEQEFSFGRIKDVTKDNSIKI